MSDLAIDISFVYALLGLRPGDDPARAQEIVINAEAYRYATVARQQLLRRMAAFLEQRAILGKPEDSFAKLRRAYYRRAMALHPDRNVSDKRTEDELKSINAAYEAVEAMRREAEEYFNKSPEDRRIIETAALQDAARETRARRQDTPPEEDFNYEDPAPPLQPRADRARRAAPRGLRYCAASVPRYIRNARLFYLGIKSVIGSKLVKNNSGGLVYDIIMLPEQEFMRAKLLLSLPVGQTSSIDLSPSKMTPAYSPMDAKCVTIPPGEYDPYNYARNWFMEKFGLDRAEDY